MRLAIRRRLLLPFLCVVATVAVPGTASAIVSVPPATNAPSVDVLFTDEIPVDPTGRDWSINRAQGPLSNGSCGTLSNYSSLSGADPASPYTDATIADGFCYSYRFALDGQPAVTSALVMVDYTLPAGSMGALPLSPFADNKTLTGTAVDSGSGVDSISIVAIDPPAGPTFPCNGVGVVSGAWSCPWDTDGFPDGTYSVDLFVFDLAGNYNGPFTRTVTLDNTHPLVSFTAPAATPLLTTTTLAGTASDVAFDRVDVVEVGVPATVLCSDNALSGGAWSCDLDPELLSNGSHNLVARGYDMAGNTTDSTPQRTVTVTNPSVDVAPGSFSVTEGSAAQVVQVELSRVPTADVTVTLSSSDGAATISPSTLTFTVANFDTPQPVTITAVDDALDEPSPAATAVTGAVTSTDPDWNGRTLDLAGAVVDDDTHGVSVAASAGATIVSEAGATDSFAVALTSEPRATVTVAVATGSQVGATPTTLTFTPLTWATAQTVTVTAVNDDVDEPATHLDGATFTVTSTDLDYAGEAVPAHTITVVDNDDAGVVFDTLDGSIAATEAGAGDSFGLRLATRPAANVTVAFTSMQLTFAPSSFTFTPANWNVAQVAAVTAIADALNEGSHVTVPTGTLSSADVIYSALPVTGPQILITDGVAPAVTLAQVADLRRDGRLPLRWVPAALPGGPLSYVVQSRTAPASGGVLSRWRTVFGPTKLTSRTLLLPTQGSTYCFRIIPTNAAGLVGASSAERCTATPVDDRIWQRTRGWTRAARAGTYRSTVTRSTTRGAFLDLGITGTRAAILATRCPTCGTLRVRFKGRVVATFNLRSRTVQPSQQLRIKSFGAVAKGTLRLEVVGARRLVELDGVLVWR
ncbi:MAG: hypothetical protein JWM90_2131 [Thermoleophilia bacterium]|nr:hypothetical protein [Thermoleophilia bacterium]